MAAPKDTYLTLYYDIDGNLLEIEPASGAKPKKLTKAEFKAKQPNIDGITTTILASIPGNSPCCVWYNGEWHCWC